MKLTKGQEKDFYQVMAFWSLPTVPTDSDIAKYLGWQEQGVKFNTHENPNAAELMLCRSLAYGKPFSVQENLWLDGHFSGDYSLALVVREFIRDAIGHPGLWFQRLPAYEMAYNLHLKLKGYL